MHSLYREAFTNSAEALRVDHEKAIPDKVLVNGQEVPEDKYSVSIEVDDNGVNYVVVELDEDYKNSIAGSSIEIAYGEETASASVEKGSIVGFAILDVVNTDGTEAIVGDSGTFEVDSLKPVQITSSGDADTLMNVYVNGKLVDKKYYTVRSGSTIITFTEEFLETLPKDTELEVVMEFGDVKKNVVEGISRTGIVLKEDPEESSSEEDKESSTEASSESSTDSSESSKESSAEETKKSDETEKGSEEETKAGKETKATDETKTSEESKSAAETEKSSETEASRDSSVVVTGEEIRLPLLLAIAAISLLGAAGLAIVRKRR
ncbi:MAG: hypothetical protein IKS18_00980 [Lachnospiraceae bacterium]|nr:hypothetical protein [Lachnospiraceae bacterium]